MKQKTRILIYILIAISAVILGTIAIITNHNSDKPATAEEHLDLGRIYLNDLSYENAVLEFTEAIEIEPLNADAYLGLAEAYSGMGDLPKAVETLETGIEKTGDQRLKDMLEELQPPEETTAAETALAAMVTTNETTTAAETEAVKKDETVELYIPCSITSNNVDLNFEFEIYNNGKYKIVAYEYEGILCSRFERCRDFDWIGNSFIFNCSNDGFNISPLIFTPSFDKHIYVIAEPAVNIYDLDGNMIQKGENIYNEKGNLIEASIYNKSGELLNSIKYEYDKNNNLIIKIRESGEETIYSYDTDGNVLGETYHSKNGSHSWVYTYDLNGNIKTILDDDDIFYSDSYYDYDQNGKLHRVIKKCSSKNAYETVYELSYEFDSNENLIKGNGTSAIGDSEIFYEYDFHGRCIKRIDSRDNSNSVAEYSFDVNGNLVKKIITTDNGDTYYDVYEYDSQNRLIKNNITLYDSQNRLTQTNNTLYYYNEHDYVEKIDYGNQSIEYTYVKVEIPKSFAEQLNEAYGIDLTE